jgi:hypothetical protein
MARTHAAPPATAPGALILLRPSGRRILATVDEDHDAAPSGGVFRGPPVCRGGGRCPLLGAACRSLSPPTTPPPEGLCLGAGMEDDMVKTNEVRDGMLL